jgi:hypothetical protein
MTSYNEETDDKYFLEEPLFDLGESEKFENSLIFESFVEDDQDDDQEDVLSEDDISSDNVEDDISDDDELYDGK